MKVSEEYPVPNELERRVAKLRDEAIDLADSEMRKGRRIRDTTVDAVQAMATGTSGFPSLLPGEEFSGGSFGRRTQAQPLDDIDLFFPLDAAALRMESPSNSPTRERLVTSSDENALGCRSQLYTGDWLDSGKVLDHIVELLCRNLPLGIGKCEKNARARCVHMTYEGINVDLVFVLMSEVPGSIDRYYLPTGDSWCWKATNPKEDQRQLSDENQRHNGLLLPTIRALKAWNDHWLGGTLKSVHLEVLASHYVFRLATIDNVVSALTYAFHELPAQLARECPDPTGLGDPLDVNLHPDDREWVIGEAEGVASLAVEANQLAVNDPAEAARKWRQILLMDGQERPERGRQPRPPRHNGDFGQPAHHCDEPYRYKQFGVPLPRSEDRPTRAPNQSGRSGEYA